MEKARRMFPIMDGEDIPWEVIAPCEARAQLNHSQTLERLAERGGLAPYEAIWVLTGTRIKWGKQPNDGQDRLRAIVKERYYLPRIAELEAEIQGLRELLGEGG